MNIEQRYAAAVAAGDHALVTELEAMAWDTAYSYACELESPNSPDFDALQERIYEVLLS